MKGMLIAALIICLGIPALSQANMVLNPDFEQMWRCPTEFDQIKFARYWRPLDTLGPLPSDTMGNYNCTPEFCHTCSPKSYTSVPDNGYFYQYPRSGNGMAQVMVFFDETVGPDPYQRDYLQGRLIKNLSPGKSYCAKFYAVLVEASSYSIKDVSAYLDNGAINSSANSGLPLSNYTPQITASAILRDTMNWTKIEGSFIANGTERFITIGNFRSKAQTTYSTVPLSRYNIGSRYTWYLVDDVSVIESDLKADAGPDKHVGKGDTVYIGRPKEVGLECTWTVLGSTAVIGTGAGIWVNPSVTTSYVVTQTLCGSIKKDTVRVEVWGVGIHSLFGQVQEYSISPNPGKAIVSLRQIVKDDRQIEVSVLELTGKRVYNRSIVIRDDFTLDLSGISPGMYYIVIKDHQGNSYTLKYVLQ